MTPFTLYNISAWRLMVASFEAEKSTFIKT